MTLSNGLQKTIVYLPDTTFPIPLPQLILHIGIVMVVKNTVWGANRDILLLWKVYKEKR